MNTPITSEQLKTILANVYGLLDMYGNIFTTTDLSWAPSYYVVLYGNEDGIYVLKEGASVNGSALTLVRDGGIPEQFTLLGTVNGNDVLRYTELLKQD